MSKRLTIEIDEEVYAGLQRVVGSRRVSKFVEDLIRQHVLFLNPDAAYADMTKHAEREKQAEEWTEATFKDVAHETA